MSRSWSPGTLRREQRGKTAPRWVLDYRDGQGVRRRVSLGGDKGVAERLRSQLIHRRDLEAAGLGAVEGMSRSLREVVDVFLVDLSIRATSEHVRNTRAHLDHILGNVAATRVRDLTPAVLIAYRAKRIQGGCSHQTANHAVRAAKTALSWAVQAGLISESPIARLKPLKITDRQIRRKRRALSDDELGRFLEAAREDDALMRDDRRASTVRGKGSGGPRSTRAQRVPQAAMWRAFAEVGARYAEMTSTRWDDLDVEARVLRFRGETTKNGKPRSVPLRQELVDELLALSAVHVRVFGKPGPRIFLTPTGMPWPAVSRNCLRVFFRILKRARIPRRDELGRCVDLHALRRTCATRLARNGVPVTTAQRILGHSSVELTAKHYVDVGLDEMRAAIERLEPLTNTAKPMVGGA